MERDVETGAPVGHWLRCVRCGNVYEVLADEMQPCPACGSTAVRVQG